MKYENFPEAKKIVDKINKLKDLHEAISGSSNVAFRSNTYSNLNIGLNGPDEEDKPFLKLATTLKNEILNEIQARIKSLTAELEKL